MAMISAVNFDLFVAGEGEWLHMPPDTERPGRERGEPDEWQVEDMDTRANEGPKPCWWISEQQAYKKRESTALLEELPGWESDGREPADCCLPGANEDDAPDQYVGSCIRPDSTMIWEEAVKRMKPRKDLVKTEFQLGKDDIYEYFQSAIDSGYLVLIRTRGMGDDHEIVAYDYESRDEIKVYDPQRGEVAAIKFFGTVWNRLLGKTELLTLNEQSSLDQQVLERQATVEETVEAVNHVESGLSQEELGEAVNELKGRIARETKIELIKGEITVHRAKEAERLTGKWPDEEGEEAREAAGEEAREAAAAKEEMERLAQIAGQEEEEDEEAVAKFAAEVERIKNEVLGPGIEDEYIFARDHAKELKEEEMERAKEEKMTEINTKVERAIEQLWEEKKEIVQNQIAGQEEEEDEEAVAKFAA